LLIHLIYLALKDLRAFPDYLQGFQPINSVGLVFGFSLSLSGKSTTPTLSQF